MTTTVQFLAAGLCAAFFLTPVAQAQQQKCAPQEQIGLLLMQRFGESVIGRGVINEERIVELYVSPTDDRTFTIVITTSKGVSCLAMSGNDWEFARPTPPGRKS